MARRYHNNRYRDPTRPVGGEDTSIFVNPLPPCEAFSVNILVYAHANLQEDFYVDKLVLAFEGLTSVTQAKQRISLYNKQSDYEL